MNVFWHWLIQFVECVKFSRLSFSLHAALSKNIKETIVFPSSIVAKDIFQREERTYI